MSKSLLNLLLAMSAMIIAPFPAMALPILDTTMSAIATALDLDGEGTATTHIVKVADVEISTENSNGLTLTITSGTLTKFGGEEISFQVTTVANNSNSPESSEFTVSSGDSYIYATDSATVESRDVYIRYTPQLLQDPGTYEATLELSVTDN